MAEAAQRKVLLILAGLPGVGKSTLLETALRRGIPIFGREFDDRFQATKPPPDGIEDGVPGERKHAAGTWFQEADIDYLMRLEALPDTCVMHLDLYHCHRVLARSANLPEDIGPLLSPGVPDLADDRLNQARYRAFAALPVFRRFDHVLVNTLQVPFDVAAAQFLRRQAARGRVAGSGFWRTLFDVYERGEAGAAAYASIYRSWLAATDVLRPRARFLSEREGGRIRIRRLDVPREAAG